jgi:hypothetical protein
MILKNRYFVLMISILISFTLISCGRMAYRSEHPKVGGGVVGAPGMCPDFSGIWDTNIGTMELNQVGYRINGAGNFPHGYADIDGEIRGGQLEFQWKGKNASGHGYLIVDEATDQITGEWGLGDEFTGGGAITGTKVR